MKGWNTSSHAPQADRQENPALSELTIRPEQPGDIAAISDVTERAFRTAPHSEHTEHFIVLALRRAGALSLSLVAERAGQVIGHVAFSPVRIADGSLHWYGLGPVSVLPESQRQGIGKALIQHGLATLRTLGAAGCVVLGDPDYYGGLGFKSGQGLVYPGVPDMYFQSLAFGQPMATGSVTYHEAFDAKG
jgi:predicted N-acetyltransferase YhbS